MSVSTRSVGLIVLAVAAVAVFFTMAPEEPQTSFDGSTYRTLIDTALDDYEANDDLAESAPQQTVVNGWVARDLLHILARVEADQLDATVASVSEPDERVPAMLALALVAMAWWALTEPVRESSRRSADVGLTPADDTRDA